MFSTDSALMLFYLPSST